MDDDLKFFLDKVAGEKINFSEKPKPPACIKQSIKEPNGFMDALIRYVEVEGINVFENENPRGAFYSPDEDYIELPIHLVGKVWYYESILHELVHSSGISRRLNRNMYGSRMDEEAVAVIGSWILLRKFGIEESESDMLHAIKQVASYEIGRFKSEYNCDHAKLIKQHYPAAKQAAEFILRGGIC